jgi:hypothetical protein
MDQSHLSTTLSIAKATRQGNCEACGERFIVRSSTNLALHINGPVLV